MHDATVSEHGHLVAGAKDLVQAMRDIDDSDSVGSKPGDCREESLHLPRFERGGRLIHDDDAMVGGHRACDRDHLLHAETQLAQRSADVDVDPVGREDLAGLPMHAREVDQPKAVLRLMAKEQVPRNAQQGDEVDLLVDRADPGGLGIAWPGELDRDPAIRDLPAIGLMDTGEDLDQRGLPGAVLADQGPRLPGAEGHRHVLESDRAGEALRDALHLEYDLAGRSRGGGNGR